PPPAPDLVLYDGGCGLCHRSVSFLARRDQDGSGFVFAPSRARRPGPGAGSAVSSRPAPSRRSRRRRTPSSAVCGTSLPGSA
ncbi:MAG: DUF393 domain-containing protein, partial [Deltaproteobacteria bacterium]|nr:DUF393 domain-containing protein [Deltaproteobacteria bacterium]